MKDLIIIAGAPGSGKSTVSRLLNEKLGSVWIDFGKLREFHLDMEWKNASEAEEQMTFENLVSIINNYIKHGYKNIIVDDLKDFRVEELHQLFRDSVVVSLFADDSKIEKRITSRNEGWKDVEKAVKWNQDIKSQTESEGGYKIDNTSLSPEDTVEKILNILNS